MNSYCIFLRNNVLSGKCLLCLRKKDCFLDLQMWLEGSYELGSFPSIRPIHLLVHPSSHPSFFPAVFWELAHYFLLKLCKVLGAPIDMCVWQPNFLDKSPSGKNNQKWPENRCFGLFRKIYSLVLFENSVEWKYLWPFSFLWKPHMCEKSSSQVMAKNALYQKYPGFLHLDMNEHNKV